MRREAQSERDLRGWEELAPPPTAADVAAARHESFSAHASRLCAVSALTVIAWAGLVGCLIAGAVLAKEWSTEFILWCACVAAFNLGVDIRCLLGALLRRGERRVVRVTIRSGTFAAAVAALRRRDAFCARHGRVLPVRRRAAALLPPRAQSP